MKQSAKTFGYGFSALVLALGGVVMSPNVNTVSAATVTYKSTLESGQVKDEDGLKAAIAANATVVLCEDITLSKTLEISVDGTFKINLNGKTLSGNIKVGADTKLTVVDDSTNGTGKVSATGAVFTYGTSKSTTITISGGTFTADTLFSAGESEALGKTSNISITGGDFTGVSKIKDSDLVALTIARGVFSTNPSTLKNVDLGANTVYTDGSKYAVATASVFTGISTNKDAPTAKTMQVNADKAEQLFTVKSPVSDYGDITNSLKFTIEDADAEDSSSALVENADEKGISEYFMVTAVTTDQGSDKDSKTDDTVGYKFIAQKAGNYIVTITTNDGTKGYLKVTSYDYNEAAAIKDIYVIKSDNKIDIDLTSRIKNYVGDNAIATAATITENEDNLEVDGKVVTIKAGADAKDYTFSIQAGAKPAETHTIHVIDTEAQTYEFAEVKKDDDGEYIGNNKVKVSTIWNVSNIDKNSVKVERNLETDGSKKDTVTVTPTSVGTATVTYTLDLDDAWFFDPEAVTTTDDGIVTDSSKIAKATKDYTKKVTYYTYEVNSGIALEHDDDAPGTEQLTGIVKVDTKNVAVAAEGDSSNNDGTELSSDKKAIVTTAADKQDKYTFTLSATGTTDEEIKNVVINTYGKETVVVNKDLAAKYLNLGESDTVTISNTTADKGKVLVYSSNSNVELVLSSDNDNIAEGTTKYTASEVGKDVVSYKVMLGETELASFDMTYNVYGLDLDSDYYVQPGATFELPVSDPYGTITVSSATAGEGDKATAIKNYDYSNGVFTLTAGTAEEDYHISFRDLVDDGTTTPKVITKDITIHVANTYVKSSEDSFVMNTTKGSQSTDKFTIDATSSIKSSVKATFDEKAVVAGIDLQSISTKDKTYQINVDDNVLPGTYVMTVELDNGGASTEITIKVVKDAKVTEAVYNIASALDENMVLDVKGASIDDSANVQLYKSNDTLAQQFLITADEDGYYTITNVKSGKVLDVAGAGTANGTNVQQYESNGTLAQKWIARVADGTEEGDDVITFVSALDENIVLDLAGGAKTNGTNAQVYENNATAAQQWKLKEVTLSDAVINDINGGLIDADEDDDTLYTIVSALDSNMVIDIAGGSSSDSANAQIYTNNGTGAQQFKFVYNETAGYYTIVNAASGKVLDVAGGARNNGANVQQYTANDTVAQKWVLEQDNGYVSFKSLHSGLYLDIAWGSAKDGSNVQLYKGNGTKAQKFRLVEVAE